MYVGGLTCTATVVVLLSSLILTSYFDLEGRKYLIINDQGGGGNRTREYRENLQVLTAGSGLRSRRWPPGNFGGKGRDLLLFLLLDPEPYSYK